MNLGLFSLTQDDRRSLEKIHTTQVKSQWKSSPIRQQIKIFFLTSDDPLNFGFVASNHIICFMVKESWLATAMRSLLFRIGLQWLLTWGYLQVSRWLGKLWTLSGGRRRLPRVTSLFYSLLAFVSEPWLRGSVPIVAELGVPLPCSRCLIVTWYPRTSMSPFTKGCLVIPAPFFFSSFHNSQSYREATYSTCFFHPVSSTRLLPSHSNPWPVISLRVRRWSVDATWLIIFRAYVQPEIESQRTANSVLQFQEHWLSNTKKTFNLQNRPNRWTIFLMFHFVFCKLAAVSDTRIADAFDWFKARTANSPTGFA